MITREEDIDAHALHRQGWTISAIARHLGRDRKTIRAYLRGDREAGVRAPAAADPFGPFAVYCSARLAEDPHLWATTLFDEVTALGYDRSYPAFTRQLRARGLRPHCEPCHPAAGRPVAVIEHPPGDETQWDWVELPGPPAAWGWGARACLLVGALAHSGRWRGWLSASMDQPHLIEGLDQVTRALGGVTAAWRFDRMATVVHPESGRVTASFAAVAKHYGVSVRPCPPRRGNRKGVVAITVLGRRLTERDAEPVDLAGADLAGADLTGAVLAGAVLARADLLAATLVRADLSGADLGGARLTGADLVGADLTDADLTDADFADADLASAKFTGAELTGALWPADGPVPEGWKRHNGSGQLIAASTGADRA